MSQGFQQIGTERLECLRIAPERSGTPLVFLHEALGSVGAWRDFPHRLCDQADRPGLVYSRRGYGRSSPQAVPRDSDYLQREAWAVLPALLAQLGIERPLLVGHDDGAAIALLYAARREPAAIVVIAPCVFAEPMKLEAVRSARAAWEAGKLDEGLARLHADPVGAFRGWNNAWLAPAFRDWSIEAELARVSCPVLAIQGCDDTYGSQAQVESIAAGVSGDCELLLLENCGHAPHRDQTDVVASAIAALAARLTPP